MAENYFKIPFDVAKLISNNNIEKCSLDQSIAHNIHLINTSYFGEYAFDESFGCCIWDVDFDNLSSSTKIKEIIRKSLLDSLKNHEKRLDKIRVEVNVKQEEINEIKNSTIIKKKINLRVKAKIRKTNEDFLYNEFFFIGPLSY